MRAHDLLTQVVPLINDDINEINSGGCGFFAYWLQQTLAAKGVKADIVLVRWSYYTASSVDNLLTKLKVKDINEAYLKIFGGSYDGYCDPCFGHLAVKVNDRLYDCDGLLHKQAISEAIKPEVMDVVLHGRAATRWNRTFKDCNDDSVVQDIRTFLTKALNGATA